MWHDSSLTVSLTLDKRVIVREGRPMIKFSMLSTKFPRSSHDPFISVKFIKAHVSTCSQAVRRGTLTARTTAKWHSFICELSCMYTHIYHPPPLTRFRQREMFSTCLHSRYFSWIDYSAGDIKGWQYSQCCCLKSRSQEYIILRSKRKTLITLLCRNNRGITMPMRCYMRRESCLVQQIILKLLTFCIVPTAERSLEC